jgi:hypothetical protein
MTVRGRIVAAFSAACCLVAGWGAAFGAQTPPDSAWVRTAAADTAAARTAPGDSSRALSKAAPADTAGAQGGAGAPRSFFQASPFDTIDASEFRERHAISLDHFLETEPGMFAGRRGPIGADAAFSRYGFGNARARLYLGDIPLNDPQDDRYPLAVFTTTLLGDLAIAAGDDAAAFLPEVRNIEGSYRVLEPAAPAEKPVVAIEFSRGDRNLRQRRLRFSSIEAPVGVDFEFDELLNDGYAFDARGEVSGQGYGKSSARSEGGNLRGSLAGGADYAFSFRRFTSVSDGDLTAADSELRRDGHLASMRVSARSAGLSVFERTHKASAPDSVTGSHTTGVYASAGFGLGADVDVIAGAGYEDIHSRQTMGGAETRPRLEKAHAGLSARFAAAKGISIGLDAGATHCFDLETGWGGGASAGKWFGGGNRVLVSIARRFRMPNLGELFQPVHKVRTDTTISLGGSEDVGEETALEASAAWLIRAGGFTSELKATGLRVEDPIFFDGGAGSVRLARNGAAEDIVILDERALVEGRVVGFSVGAGASLEYAAGDRVRFFAGVPEYRITASATVGRVLFKNSSGFRLSAEYVRVGSRRSGSSDPLSPYGVLNLKLDVRLIDANLYAQWLNVTDESYETVWPYLATPLTFAYGIEWSIFD